MRIRRLLSLLVLPLALAACENGAAPAPPAEIEGLWLRLPTADVAANLHEQLVFGPGDRYVREVLVYANAGHGTPVSGYKEEGAFRLRGDRLELRITRETEWDVMTGGVPAVTVRPGTWADAGTVRVDENSMERTYTTYPAEAPVETTVRYFRPGLD